MCYIKAVLETLAEVGIEETDLLATDFSAIAEWEKEEIPLDFLLQVLRTEFSRDAHQESRSGMVGQLEPIVFEEYAVALMRAS